MLDACYFAEMCAAPPTAAEVCSDVVSAYRAHAETRYRACEYAPMPDAINLQYLSLPVVSCFLLGYCSLENCKDQLSGAWLRLSQRYRSTARVLVVTGEAETSKNEPTK